jgi:trypsin
VDLLAAADKRPYMRRLPLLLLLAAIAVLLASAPAGAAPTRTPAPAERIINGQAPSQPWPAQTSVSFNGMVCGGTLLSARWVLTAGHCATDAGGALPPGDFTLNVGGTTRSNGSHVLVDRVVVDPDFTPQTNFAPPTSDLTLLHLANAVAQEPLRLVGTGGAEAALWGAGVAATVIGWGITENNVQSTFLREAQVPMVGDSACSVPMGASFHPASMVCAGGGATDTCGGDSGGPLMTSRAGVFTLVGVTSWGAGCGRAGFPGVYSRAGAAAPNAWIRSLVATADLTATPAAPVPGETVRLTATVAPGEQPTAPTSLSWDLDDDGAYDDATGPVTETTFAAGSHVVRVQAPFANGDRAAARAIVTAADAAAPVIAPVTLPPVPQPTPAQIQAVQRIPAPAPVTAPAPIGTVTVPARVKLGTLRGTSLRVSFSCERACTISGRMTLDAATARRFGLHRGETIGRGSGSRVSGGRSTMTVQLTSRAKRALRNRGRFTVRLATDLRGAGAIAVRGTQTVTVSR